MMQRRMVSTLSTPMSQEAWHRITPDPDKPVTPDPDYKKYGALNVFKKVIQNVTDDQKSLPTEKFDFTAKI